MEGNQHKQPPGRDYSSISPSAKALLFLKGHTQIPFAREAAQKMLFPGKFEPDFNNKDFRFWLKVVHFESRYRSIDQLLAGLPVKNILEIASGFSFRGLAAIQQEGIHYIDADLPEVIGLKKQLVNELMPVPANASSLLELLPLNAMDEKAFKEIVARFPAGGPLVIVNEGLLMYLGTAEKEQLCKIIHNVLDERGGYWITADIYIKQRTPVPGVGEDDELNRFFQQHHVREQMFDSFEAAKGFFNRQDFIIDKEAIPNPAKLSSLPYLLQSASQEQLKFLRQRRKIQATWRF